MDLSQSSFNKNTFDELLYVAQFRLMVASSYISKSPTTRRTILVIFDRVMHYHRELFRRLETELELHGLELVLMSGREKSSTTGRVALATSVVKNQIEFELSEWPIGNFMLRFQHGVAKEIAAIKPAMVITMCHSGTLSEWQIIKMKRRHGFRLMAWQCGYEFNPSKLKQLILGKFIPCFDHHLAYHTNAKHYAIAHGARPDQVTVMHNTINEAAIMRLPRQQARALIAKKWPVIEGKKLILYVGAILEEKRLDVIFDALDILHHDDALFLMVGDGPYRQTIVNKHGKRTDFLSTGQIIDQVGPYFDASDVFVLPGTGGLAINEAMAHALPIISGYADGSADDLVVDGKSGYRLRDGSARELATRLDDLLANTENALAMGEKGQAMIHGELSFERFIQRVVGVLTAPQPRPSAA